MNLLSIKNGQVAFEASGRQCARLAKICRFAADYAFDEEIDAWATLAGLFQAGTVAGFAQGQMCPADEAALAEQLRLAGLETLLGQTDVAADLETPFSRESPEKQYRRERAAGEQAATLLALRQTLTIRLGTAWDYADRFAALEATALNDLHAAALQAQDLAAFEATLGDIGAV